MTLGERLKENRLYYDMKQAVVDLIFSQHRQQKEKEKEA